MTRLVFMGTPEFAVPALAALLDAGYEIVGVLTKEDQPAGRGQKLEVSAVKQLAQAHGLTIQQPRTLRAAEARAALAGLAPDVIVVAAYGLILPQEVLDLPRFGCINVHGSVLPRGAGPRPSPRPSLPATSRPASASCGWMPGSTPARCSARHICPSPPTTRPARSPRSSPAWGPICWCGRCRAGWPASSPPPATGRGRHLGPADYKGRRADRLDRAGSADRTPCARLPALADGVHALERAGVEGSAGVGGSGVRGQESGVRGQGSGDRSQGAGDRDDYCRKGGKCGGGDGNGRAVVGGDAVGGQTGDTDRRVPAGRAWDSWKAGCHRKMKPQIDHLRFEAVAPTPVCP